MNIIVKGGAGVTRSRCCEWMGSEVGRSRGTES